MPAKTKGNFKNQLNVYPKYYPFSKAEISAMKEARVFDSFGFGLKGKGFDPVAKLIMISGGDFEIGLEDRYFIFEDRDRGNDKDRFLQAQDRFLHQIGMTLEEYLEFCDEDSTGIRAFRGKLNTITRDFSMPTRIPDKSNDSSISQEIFYRDYMAMMLIYFNQFTNHYTDYDVDFKFKLVGTVKLCDLVINLKNVIDKSALQIGTYSVVDYNLNTDSPAVRRKRKSNIVCDMLEFCEGIRNAEEDFEYYGVNPIPDIDRELFKGGNTNRLHKMEYVSDGYIYTE